MYFNWDVLNWEGAICQTWPVGGENCPIRIRKMKTEAAFERAEIKIGNSIA